MKGMHFLARTSILLLSAFYITSCREMEQENEIVAPVQSAANRTRPELAYPEESGILKQGTLFGNEITYAEIDNKAVYEGDIILTREQLDEGKSARTEAVPKYSANGSGLWPNAVVSYTIDASITDKETLLSAIAAFEASTPIRFVMQRFQPALPGSPVIQSSYVTFTKAGRGGYSSSIGRVGGQQFVTLPLGFTKGGAMHEIAHTVGLLHEHTRYYRYQTIKVNLNNVAEVDQPNLKTYTELGYPAYDFGVMDLESITMLDSYAYSKNGLPVMTLLNGATFGVQRDHLSKNDISGITAMYSNLYALTATGLFSGDVVKGKKVAYPGIWENWVGAKALFGSAGYVHIEKQGGIYNVDWKTGDGFYATNGAGVKGMVYYKGFMYFLRDGYLWKIAPKSGSTAAEKIGGQLWLPATAMTYAYGFFFIVSGDILFRVTPENGIAVSLGAGYKGVTELAGLKNHLYILNKGKLSKMNTNTGVSFPHGANIFGAGAQMAASGENLMITYQDALYSMDPAGAHKFISSGWSDVIDLAATSPEEK